MLSILCIFSLLITYSFFFFNLATAYIACGTLVLQLGIKPTPPALEGWALTTEPPGKSLTISSYLPFTRCRNLGLEALPGSELRGGAGGEPKSLSGKDPHDTDANSMILWAPKTRQLFLPCPHLGTTSTPGSRCHWTPRASEQLAWGLIPTPGGEIELSWGCPAPTSSPLSTFWWALKGRCSWGQSLQVIFSRGWECSWGKYHCQVFNSI